MKNVVRGFCLLFLAICINSCGVDDDIEPNPTPNPPTAQDYILIDYPLPYKDLKYDFYDINGKLIMSGNGNGNTVNISKLNSGAYILKVNIDGRKLEKKIIKE